MATKNGGTQAERASAEAKKKNAAKKGGKGSSKKNASQSSKKPKVANLDFIEVFPNHVLIAVASLGLFILFLVAALDPNDGWILAIVRSIVLGLIGKVGFYFSIPALLYLFAIHTFGRKTKVQMRSICTILFVFFCGCIYHLSVETGNLAVAFNLLPELYAGGVDGSTGGILCGSIAMLVRWCCGSTISFVLFIVAAILTLLGAMRITIVTLYQAFQNRPRDEEAEEREERDPATVVVNHLANKRIEHNRQKRQRLEQSYDAMDEDEMYVREPAPRTMRKADKNDSKRAKALMEQIDSEPTDPVAAAGEVVEETHKIIPEEKPKEIPAPKPVKAPLIEEKNTPIPNSMPELRRGSAISAGPKMEKEDPKQDKVTSKDTAVSAVEVAAEIAAAKEVKQAAYCFPPINLLNRPTRGSADGTMEMRENSRRLNETLASFKIDAHIVNVTRGPSVTRYEVELDKGVRLNKLTSVADDIALSLGAASVRIAPVPGKISVVGIEVPNRAVSMVALREVIDSPEFAKSKSKSSFAVGKDIGDHCIVGNIAKMPHMLIAGTTGSGKSVCMNSIILSLLYKSGPEDVKLIMVDPKMVELANYNGIPHLMIPVVTDPKKAAGALQWAVTEMMRRYKTMSDSGVRDLESFNGIVEAEGGEKLPQLIVIIDELADLMLVAAKEVEDSICRIAQMGRAAGIHLVIATQRPSADVITGLMKANIPSRIAFSVASGIESRIILDTVGAEKLVGKGDMLFAPIGSGKPLRVQGCFVSDAEVEAVTSYIKQNYVSNYDQQVLADIEKAAQNTGKKASPISDPEPNDAELDGDEMLPAAVDVILETGQASVSMLQRRLKLGYARAARIVDEMEEKGIVGPFQGSKPRAILITKEQWASMKGGQPEQMAFTDMEEEYSHSPEEFE